MPLLLRKLRRDLLQHGSQFVSVLLMSALSVTVYAGLEGAWRGMQVEIERVAAVSVLPDAWVGAVATTRDDVARFGELPGVQEVSRASTFTLQHGTTGTLLVTASDADDVNTPIVTSGSEVTASGGGIWLDESYARANGIEVGDVLTLARPGAVAGVDVRGLVLIPDALALTAPGLISPDFDRYAAAIVSPETAAETFSVPDTGDTLRIVGDAEEVREAAPGILGDRYLGVVDRTSNASIAPVFDRVEQIRGVSIMFSALFVVVALLAMSTSIRRLVEIQRGEIATLSALGMSARSIGMYFVGLSTAVVGIGALLGASVAPMLSAYVLETQKDAFALPNWRMAFSWTAPALVVLLLISCAGAAWAVSARARSLSPAEGMRPAAESFHRTLVERWPSAWSRIGYGARWALRDAVGNPVRIAVGVIASAGCMMLLVAGFGIPESLSYQVNRGYEDQYRYRDWVAVTPDANPEQLAALEQAAGPGQWVMQRPVRAGETEYVLTVLGAGDLFIVRDDENRILDLSRDAAITPRIAAAIGTGPGEKVDITIGTRTVPLDLGANARVSQPQGVLVGQREWMDAGGVFTPTAYLTRDSLAQGALDDVAAATTTLPLARQKANAEQVISSLSGVFDIMKVLAVLLAVVSLYNLGALGFSERRRSYATLRVLGSRDGELRRLAATENALTTVIGWLAGIPLGLWFLGSYVALFSDDRAVYEPHASAATLVAASAVTLLFAMTATMLLSRRIRRIEMSSAVKGVE